MEHFLPFFITLIVGLFFSVAFKRFHLPWVITLILAGVAIGPHGLDWFEIDQTIAFMSQSGLILLMFMAGMETKLSSFKKMNSKIYLLALINGIIPFVCGLAISSFIGLDFISSLLIGIIFISSSIAVVIPSLEANKLLSTPLGSSVLATSIIQDIASLILLSLFLQTEQHFAKLPLYIFYPLVAVILIIIRTLLPGIKRLLFRRTTEDDDVFQRDLRVILLILFGVVIIFELLGLHAIIAGFFTGLVLSESMKSDILIGKIRAISYGIFIPTFFIVVGIETDLSALLTTGNSLVIAVLLVSTSIISKMASGTLGAKIVGFNNPQSLFFGASSIPQLSTTLAATYTAREFGLIDESIVAAMVVLSVISILIGPLLMTSMIKFVLSNKDIKNS